MAKSLLTALKRVSELAQADDLGMAAIVGICNEVSEFIGGSAVILDGRGKVLAQTIGKGMRAVFRLRESVDGLYIDSRVSDRLCDITVSGLNEDFHPKDDGYHMTVFPLYAGAERLATIIAYKVSDYRKTDMEFLEACGAIALLVIRNAWAREADHRRRDIDAVKQAIDALSYSELAAVLHVFNELGGEGLLVASRLADREGLTRSIIVSALRKLESAGVIETRSLGVKGTYIKILNYMLPEELYKIRK